ncbi:MAG: glutathione S-transferase family protein [Planctomycetota bacterium]|jgi:glutathione S-transferase
MILLYDHALSGNCYKVRLLFSLLGLEYESESLAVTGDRDRGEAFRAKTAIGKIPTVRLEDGRHLSESGAILWYFAEGTPYLPEDRYMRAQVVQWMSFEQNNHEPNLAAARQQMAIDPSLHPSAEQIENWRVAGTRALDVMERHLAGQDFFVGDCCSIADIALYPHSELAEEGPFDLGPLTATRAWLERMRSLPGFVPMGA